MAPGHDDVAVPYGGAYEPTDPSPPGVAIPKHKVEFTHGFRGALAIQAVLYAVGLAAWALKNDLAWAVVVYWFIALVASLSAGLGLCLIPSTRRMGGGVVVGTLVAAVVELVTTAVVWGIWLSAHPGWQLS